LNVSSKWAGARSDNILDVFVGGVQGVSSGAVGALGAPTLISIGQHGGLNYFFGTIGRVAYYPQRISNANLQSVTT
jgi:hypothetical protein